MSEKPDRTRILNRQDLARVAADLHAAGKRLVATNGCFDILHVGHTRYLEEARKLGDVLIVGINSDKSVQQLKGPHRPLNSEQDRAEILSSLRCVDYVTIFGEQTADEFLKAVKPQIYAKGGDYTHETLPETPLMKSLGGEVVFIKLIPGKSTTQLLARMQEK
jgi:glycerol-3-phosphate cytidylyltransferase